MVTVDDLVISLKIKPTGKLSDLQKQLEAIVGKKGEKAPRLGVGFDPAMKEDIDFIKRRVVFLMPTEIPGKATPFAMAETAATEVSLLKADLRSYAEKLVPKRQDVLEATMKEFGVESRDDLVDALEDKIRDWILRLEDVMKKNWVSDSAQKFLGRIDDLIKRKKFTVGKAKELMRDIDESIGERNKELEAILKKLGLTVKAEQWIAQIKREKLEFAFPSEQRDYFRQNAEELYRAFNITSDTLQKKLNFLLTQSKKWEGGTKGALEKLAQEFGIDLKTLWNITDKEVAKSEDLRALGALLTVALKEALRTGQPVGIPIGLQSTIWEALKQLRMGQIKGLPEEKREKLIKDLDSRFGKTFSEFWEKSRIDFMITDVQKNLKIIEKLYGKEVVDQLGDVESFFTEQKNWLSEANKGQARTYKELVGTKNLVYMASQVMSSFTSMFPQILTKRMNLALQAQKLGLTKELTEEQTKVIREEAQEKIGKEKLMGELRVLFKQYPDIEVIMDMILSVVNAMWKETKDISTIKADVKEMLDKWKKGEGTPEQVKKKDIF